MLAPTPRGMPAMQGVELVESLTDAVAGADIVVLVTRWKEFEALPDVVREHAPGALVIDGRRVLPPAAFKAYEGIGR